MAFFKWFERIKTLQVQDRIAPKTALPPFDFASLKPRTIREKITARLFGAAYKTLAPPILRLCQRFWPIPAIPALNLVIVTRDADVRSVLSDSETFGVPYGPEMSDLGDGTTFGLGLDGAGHRRQRDIMAKVMWRDGSGAEYFAGDLEGILDRTQRFAEALIEGGNGRIDAVRDFITRIATETAAVHFGLDVDDPDGFAEWSLAASCMLFGDMGGKRQTRDVALNGAMRLRLVIRNSIARAQQNCAKHPNSTGRSLTIVDRLVQLQCERRGSADPISDADIVALLMGMVTGFVPTNTLAAAKMLAEILSRPKIFARAKAAAEGGDRETLRKILKEAARLNSALAPGQWRVARRAGWVAPGTPQQRFVKSGTILLVSTMTALRDPAVYPDAPNSFRIDRDAEGDLMFGHGPHACMGSRMAIEQITTMFMVLLAQPKLRPARGATGRMEYTGAFPVRLDMTYEHPGAVQSMFLVIVPAKARKRAQIDALLAELRNPATEKVRKMLDASGVIHFLSVTTLQSKRGLDIIAEFSVDGKVDRALSTIAEAAEPVFRPLYALAGLKELMRLDAFMSRHVTRLTSAPWGATGLDYNGTSEFSVRAIERQRALADRAGEILQAYLSNSIGGGAHPVRALTYVRRILRGDRFEGLIRRGPGAELFEEAAEAGMDAALLKPSRAQLKLADFQQPTRWGAVWAIVKSRDGWVVTIPAAALLLTYAITMTAIVWPSMECLYHDKTLIARVWSCATAPWLPWRIFWALVGIAAGAVAATAGTIILLIGIPALLLRRSEIGDQPDQHQAPLETLRAIAQAEDRPGYAQNHFMAVGEIKPGMLRTLVHAFALWAIKLSVKYYFRPGFVLDMGTIHYARWWRLPGTRTGVFFSNYDGSWESYLEDFITRVSKGQTAAWSNWIGFPKTRWLIYGAEDGARFKRWVRTQQRIAPFWYSRFPDLTAAQIRNNALIYHGLARAKNVAEASEWLRCFGSMPRVENRVETNEVQSIVFRGMGPLRYSTCLAIQLPPLRRGNASTWLTLINGEEIGESSAGLKALAAAFPRAFRDDKGRELNTYLCITFGDRQVVGDEASDVKSGLELATKIDAETGRAADGPSPAFSAVFFGCSAAGFSTLAGGSHGEPNPLAQDLPGSFPPAFQMGMANRPQILGDIGNAAPATWRWGDADAGGESDPAEAVLLLYASTREHLDTMTAFHVALLEQCEGKVVGRRDCLPGENQGADSDLFGFRDGLSQPVIRGTERFALGAPARDIVSPGEFILGYADNQGFLPPSPLVRAEADSLETLPVASIEGISRYPDFGSSRSAGLPRDFGRNGSYLVIREIDQDVHRFRCFAERKARELNGEPAPSGSKQHSYRELFRLEGQTPTAEWVMAKMVGRWPNGRPLVGNPSPGSMPRDAKGKNDQLSREEELFAGISRKRAETDNDFAYGIDDPHGFACPFGAHIRRANPRDSKEPGDEAEQRITNRHRLLRRGRTYQSGQENGLLFVALCSDIERQFEFVQQTWVNSPSFHGLSGEPDPLTGGQLSGESDPLTRGPNAEGKNFTIPTPAGPIKLTGIEQFTRVRGGGYFFLPSRSALLFMKNVTFRQSDGASEDHAMQALA